MGKAKIPSAIVYKSGYIIRRDRRVAVPGFLRKGACDVFTDGRLYFHQVNPATHERRSGAVVIYPDGTVQYQSNTGRLHRPDGPAMIWADGSKDYWVNNKSLSPEEFFLKYKVL